MAKYECHCVNAPVGIVINNNADRGQAVKSFEDIMNHEAEDGWEYVGMDSYTTMIKPGCLNWNPQLTEQTHRMLVFRRLKGE